mmetsp:Transcript_148596/g.477082  ORF Transcript_148596/g.477082 Transcript_148596/m.477082 type:complete len:222 (-) Transcript_148596:494-1159(-)
MVSTEAQFRVLPSPLRPVARFLKIPPQKRELKHKEARPLSETLGVQPFLVVQVQQLTRTKKPLLGVCSAHPADFAVQLQHARAAAVRRPGVAAGGCTCSAVASEAIPQQKFLTAFLPGSSHIRVEYAQLFASRDIPARIDAPLTARLIPTPLTIRVARVVEPAHGHAHHPVRGALVAHKAIRENHPLQCARKPNVRSLGIVKRHHCPLQIFGQCTKLLLHL